MTVGNLVALQRARSCGFAGVLGDRAGRVHAAALRAGERRRAISGDAFSAAVTYILIYGIMNLGTFAVTTAT